MYLFEAIRLGAMSCPQGKGISSTLGLTRCAYGAAKLALGIEEWGTCPKDLLTRYPMLNNEALIQSPCYKILDDSIQDTIWKLNDVADWTREQIAQWLEPIELAYYEAHPKDRPVDVVVEEKVMETLETVHV